MANAEIPRFVGDGIPNSREKLKLPNVDEITTFEAVEALAEEQLISIAEHLTEIPSSELQMAYLQAVAGGILNLIDDVRFKREGHIPQ